MSPRNIILIAFALIAAIGTALIARNWIVSERAAMNARPKVAAIEASQYVLVAKANLPAGRFVKAEDFRWQAWPEGKLPPSYMVRGKRTPEELVGAVVRAGIAAEEPVTDTRLVKPGDRGFMAAVLQPGLRAVSLSVTVRSGIAGFVFPGDRVDLLVTHTVKGGDNADRKSILVTETVLRDVRVVAIDQRTDDQNSTPIVARTITFEVTPKQAEMVNVSRRLGELTLSLRSLGREELQGELAALELEEGDASQPGDSVPAPASLKIESPEPTIAEGRFTIDSEVSRLLGGIGGEVQKVTIVRGERSKVQAFRNGMPESDRDDNAPAGNNAPPADAPEAVQ